MERRRRLPDWIFSRLEANESEHHLRHCHLGTFQELDGAAEVGLAFYEEQNDFPFGGRQVWSLMVRC